MENTQETPGSIYVQEGPNAGRIAEPLKAQEIANLEKPAIDLEVKMERQAQNELSPEQKKNVEIMEGLKTKYPEAFEKIIDEKGREKLIARGLDLTDKLPPKAVWVGHTIAFTKEGTFALNTFNLFKSNEELIETIDWSKFEDKIEERRDNNMVWKDAGYGQYMQTDLNLRQIASVDEAALGMKAYANVEVLKIDLNREYDRTALKTGILEVAQKRAEQIKSKQEEKNVPAVNSASILNSL
jgi:hypothetical protein